MTYLKIDPIEELIKAIEIVHGKRYADVWRAVISKLRSQRDTTTSSREISLGQI